MPIVWTNFVLDYVRSNYQVIFELGKEEMGEILTKLKFKNKLIHFDELFHINVASNQDRDYTNSYE